MDRRPLKRNEYIGVQDMIGGINCLHTGLTALEQRAVEAGVKDKLEQAHDMAIEAYHEILNTVPLNKLLNIQRDLDCTKVYVRVEAPGIHTVDTNLWRYVKAETLNRMVDYIANNECMFCDKTLADSRNCRIRRMMEDAMPHDLDYKAPDGCCEWSGLVLGLKEGKA